jgi:hypothetical protein
VNARRKEETVNSWLVTYESELDRHIRPRLGQRCEGEGPHGVAEPHGVVVLGAMLMMKISVSNGGRDRAMLLLSIERTTVLCVP